MNWKCLVIDRQGQEKMIDLSGSRRGVIELLKKDGLMLIELSPDFRKYFKSILSSHRFTSQGLSVFFHDLGNLLESGLSLSSSISIVRETLSDERMTKLIDRIEEGLTQGDSLSQILIQIKDLPLIVTLTIAAGEKAGRLNNALKILGDYFKQIDELRSRLLQALIYPSFVLVILVSLFLFVSLNIIPQLKGLLPVHALNNQLTQFLLNSSMFISAHCWALFVFCVSLGILIFVLDKKKIVSLKATLFQIPLLGKVFKESSIAFYLLNLSVLLKSGMPVINAIKELNTLDHSIVSTHFAKIHDYILGGSALWKAIDQDPFFPKIIPLTLRRAEEMTKIDEYCFRLYENFNERIKSQMEGLVRIIQPCLLIMGGAFLILMTYAFLFPIYGNLNSIAGGAY